jgi:putative two-component system response regulator
MVQSIVLIVDDEPTDLSVLSKLLRSEYQVRAVNSGESALRAAVAEPQPDLILLDLMMPEMDGYAVLGQLLAEETTSHIPVVFLSALSGSNDEEHGLKLGAADYISKPINPTVVLARVHIQLEAKKSRDWMKNRNTALEAEVARRMVENNLTQTVTIRALAHLAETRDPETGYHIHRTQDYVGALARELKNHPRFTDFLSESNIELLIKSAPLHDIGKVGIPDHVLLNQGKLTPEEWLIMKTHAKLGSDAIENAEEDAEQPLAFLTLAKEIAHWHHERWDGTGYPDGLVGDEIPVSARLMALADVFDALISPRVYKEPMSPETARTIIVEEGGYHFDPDIVEAFVACYDQFKMIARKHQSGE